MIVQEKTAALVVGQSVRRTQAERSASTRAKLLDAANALLHERGYAATTFAEVAARAGVSKGSALHHFADKPALMRALVEAFWAQSKARYARAVAERPAGMSPLKAFLIATLENFTRPEALADLEIWFAARADAALRDATRPAGEIAAAQGRAMFYEVLAASGFSGETEAAMAFDMGLAMLRGLTIERSLQPDPALLEAAHRWIDLLDAGALIPKRLA